MLWGRLLRNKMWSHNYSESYQASYDRLYDFTFFLYEGFQENYFLF